MIRSEDGSAGTAVVRFMVLVGGLHFIIGQDDLG